MSAAPVLVPFERRFSPASAGAGRAARRDRPVQGVGPAEVSTRRVLVVEPNSRLRTVLKVALTRAGFEVLAVSSAQAAREVLFRDETTIDLVVLEADADANGRSLCTELRAEMTTSMVPVIALCEDRAMARAASAAGADECLSKPVFARDVVSLAQLKVGSSCAERRFESDTATVSPADLVRALLSAHRAGRVDFGSIGVIEFCAGKVVRASFRGDEDASSLRRLLLFAAGRYEVRYGPVAEGETHVSLRELCRTAIPAVRRWANLKRNSVPTEAVLTADLARFLAVRPSIPAEAEAMVRRFDGIRTVEQVLLSTSIDEASALATATRLYEMGVLTPPAAKASAKGAVDPMLDGLPESARRQLEAFRIRTVVEVKRPKLTLVTPPAQRPLEVPAPTREQAVELVRAAALSLPGEPAPMQVVVRSQRPEATVAPRPVEAGRWPRLVLIGAAATAVVAGAALLSRTPAKTETAAVAPVSTRAPDRYAEALSLYDQGRFADAERALADALAARPTNANAWTLLGLVRFDGRDLEGAEGAAQKALALDGKQARAQLLLANVALARHDTESARTALSAYLALEPTGPRADDARALLTTISTAK
jgi:CheY-like chemotaxis protein